MNDRAAALETPPESALQEKVLLRVSNLHTWFELRRWGLIRVGSVRAVDGVSFSLDRGEAIAIVGESGCGKSTLAKTILGLHTPTRGSILFEERRISELAGPQGRWYKSQIGYVMQDPYCALPPFMTVKRLLEEPLIIHGVRDRSERAGRVARALTQLKLTPVEDYLSKYPHMLSGGQQQRVVIARAIILEPKLIVADEPVSMLDASVRVEILELLRGLQRDLNLGILYITHDLSTVRYFSTRILVMYGGKLVEQAGVGADPRQPRPPLHQGSAGGDRRPGRRQRADLPRGSGRRAPEPRPPAGGVPLPPPLSPSNRRVVRYPAAAAFRPWSGPPGCLLAVPQRRAMNGKTMILLAGGAGMLVGGWLLLCWQVLRLIQPGFFSSFLGYGLSFVGLLVGLGGAMQLGRARRRRDVQ